MDNFAKMAVFGLKLSNSGVLGPIIFIAHEDGSDRRSDTTGAKGIEAFLDYLYVYRRHPAPNDTLRLQRSMFLDRATGISIPTECF